MRVAGLVIVALVVAWVVTASSSWTQAADNSVQVAPDTPRNQTQARKHLLPEDKKSKSGSNKAKSNPFTGKPAKKKAAARKGQPATS